ncbi:MAG: YerC/YecD family TrpR-related protein [Patescibacteria group bacterium]
MGRTTYYPRIKRIEKLKREEILELMFDLLNAFRLVNSPLETAFLIQDLLTANEIKNLAKRLRIAKLLLEDKTQREIAQEVKVSLATVTKVNLWLMQGGEGFKRVISKLPKKYQIPKKLPPRPLTFNLPETLLILASYGLAKRQEKNLEKFLQGVENKQILDRNLREVFDEEFRK